MPAKKRLRRRFDQWPSFFNRHNLAMRPIGECFGVFSGFPFLRHAENEIAKTPV